MSGHQLAGGGGGSRRFQDTVYVSQPSLSLLQLVALTREGRQGNLEAIFQASQTGTIAMGRRFLARRYDSLKTLAGLNTGQAEAWPPSEGQQVVGMTEQLCDHGVDRSSI